MIWDLRSDKPQQSVIAHENEVKYLKLSKKCVVNCLCLCLYIQCTVTIYSSFFEVKLLIIILFLEDFYNYVMLLSLVPAFWFCWISVFSCWWCFLVIKWLIEVYVYPESFVIDAMSLTVVEIFDWSFNAHMDCVND